MEMAACLVPQHLRHLDFPLGYQDIMSSMETLDSLFPIYVFLYCAFISLLLDLFKTSTEFPFNLSIPLSRLKKVTTQSKSGFALFSVFLKANSTFNFKLFLFSFRVVLTGLYNFVKYTSSYSQLTRRAWHHSNTG